MVSWSGDYDEAVRLYEGILEKQPGNTDALMGLSGTLFWQGSYDESITTIDRVLATDPENKEALELKKKVEVAKKEATHFKVNAGFEYQKMNFATNAHGAHFLLSYNEPRKWGVRGGFDYINKFDDSAPGAGSVELIGRRTTQRCRLISSLRPSRLWFRDRPIHSKSPNRF